MLPAEQPRLYELVTEALTLYDRAPTNEQLLAWWMACKVFAMHDVERALKAHQDDADDGKRAPRPIDVVRKLRSGTTAGSGCAAVDAVAGRCEYPGIWGDGTTGGGPSYCHWHLRERSGPIAARVIQMSHEIPYAEAMAKVIENRRAAPLPPHLKALQERTARRWKGNAGSLAEQALPAGPLRMPGMDEDEAAESLQKFPGEPAENLPA